MRRRDFVVLLAGALAAWPLAARTQQIERMRRLGVLMGYASSDATGGLRYMAFRRALQDLGWTAGHNIEIDDHWPADDPDRIAADAADLVQRAPDVILASPAQMALALKKLTTSIPIVFVNAPDPVALGLVSSLARPGGNMTGFANFEHAMAGKWLDILKEMVPSVARVGVLYSMENPAWRGRLRAIAQAAPLLNIHVTATAADSDAQIGQAYDRLASEGAGALIVLPSIFAARQRRIIIDGAARHRLPAIYSFRYFISDGGLMSYGVDLPDMYWRSAAYVDRILKGEKPADLPVQAPTKYELAINLKTARALGLQVPQTLLARADEVIE